MRKLFDVVWKRAVHPSKTPKGRRAFAFEPIESRILLSVTAAFDPGIGTLSVFGDSLDNNIVLSRTAAGNLLVNGGAVSIAGGAPTVANTSVIQAFGQAGDDVISLDEANGALPQANLFGGADNDVLSGGSGDDLIFGQEGNDTLLGRGGNDLLFGGTENDTLTGGDGDDQSFGEGGNDRMIWNPGDDTDLNEGGGGVDTVEVNGGNGAEAFTLSANGARVRFDRINPAPFSIDIGTSEAFVLNANGGDDSFSATGNLAALIQTIVDGGAGNDTLLGTNGADTLIGGDGNDFVDGQQGNDVALLGAGDDTFQWDPGDGSDVVEGQAGTDTMLFNGSNASERINISANGGRARFTRDVAAITMDLNDVEQINFNALGGVDVVTIDDLTGADVAEVNVKLAGTIGGTTGDLQSDTVIVAGTNGADVIEITGAGSEYQVMGLAALVKVTEAESGDSLRVNALAGADTVSDTGLTIGVALLILDGGDGNDLLTGSSGADQLFGQAGNDILLGRGGSDLLFGGADNDTLTGGDGDDQVFGESGNDRMIWNPGDDTDLNEGGDGIDTVEVNGGNGAEAFTLSANGARVRFDRINPAPFSIDIGTSEAFILNANGGDDSFSAAGNLAALIQTTVDGGAGNDTLLGTNGADVLIGGDGNDFVDGQQGNDVALLGAGADTFQWDPGDGSDVVEGQADSDTLLFNGSNASEVFNISANGNRTLLTRNVGNIVMDLNDIELLNLNALGGVDSVTIGDLTGTDVTEVNIKLAGTIGGTTGDAQSDTVIVAGTNGADTIGITGAGGAYSVTGLAVPVNVTESEPGDALTVNALGGPDTVTALGLAAGVAQLVIDGGAGNDSILGSPGADILIGGDGNDSIDGNQGNDTALLGAGDDTFQWDPGDGSDVVEGQAGTDTLVFNGSAASERFDVSANGGRVRFTRDVGAITMDLDDVERIDVNALGGADAVTVNDLSGTDGTAINVNLAGVLGGGAGDGQADTITVNGTNGADVILAVGTTSALLTGLPAAVSIANSEVMTDRLIVNALGGDDVVNASGLGASLFSLEINGGLGNDLLIGSQGSDLVTGGDGNDTALLGAGSDTFIWNPGDDNDTIEGQAGSDALVFNGANISERIDIAANGGRVRFFRDVAAVAMDMDDVETILFNALGGADFVTIHDLSGTDVTTAKVDLTATGGGGDGQPDSIIVEGSNNADNVKFKASGVDYTVTGLPITLKVVGSESNDSLTVNTLGGNDTISANTLAAGLLLLTANGGAGNDTLLGTPGADVLLGGDGDDFVDGNGGNDTALLGAGNDTFVWDPGDGSDVVEGQDGTDTLVFNGANVNENVDISANGGRVRFFRDVASVAMDLNDVERINFNALGGADAIVVGDLSGTDVTEINLNLAASGGGGDGQADTITVNGTNGADVITINGSGGSASVSGLPATVNITSSEGANDKLIVNALGGDDVVNASGLAAGVIGLQINGGLGNDLIIGSQGNDLVTGGDGNDTALLGDGDDTFIWNPGDDNDTIEGQAGLDAMVFNGANVSENIQISANGGRARFTRDIANVVMDLNDVERIDFNALGGADTIVVNDMTGTDVAQINLALAATLGGTTGDGQADNVVVNGTNGSDVALVSGDAGVVSVAGLAALVNITGAEAANDRLTINGLAGDDVIEASALTATGIQLTENGGDGDDVLIGGDGNDILSGGAGDDVLVGGPGIDVLDGGPGDDVEIQ